MEAHERELHGITGGVDEIGVVSHQIPYLATSLSECRSVAKGRIVDGLPERSRSWQHHQGGLFIVTVLYQGQENPAVNPDLVQYSLRGSFEEEAIEANPQINVLVKKYNGRWKDGRVIFPPTYREAVSGGIGLLKGESTEKRNPMCGVEKYKKLGLVWQVTYAAPAIPGALVIRVGRVIDTPPGAPPELQGRTRWLVAEPNTQSRGNVTQVTEQYILLDEEEAPEMYKRPAE
jgi:hypothetical protein